MAFSIVDWNTGDILVELTNDEFHSTMTVYPDSIPDSIPDKILEKKTTLPPIKINVEKNKVIKYIYASNDTKNYASND
jgi:hypothetical protein